MSEIIYLLNGENYLYVCAASYVTYAFYDSDLEKIDEGSTDNAEYIEDAAIEIAESNGYSIIRMLSCDMDEDFADKLDMLH